MGFDIMTRFGAYNIGAPKPATVEDIKGIEKLDISKPEHKKMAETEYERTAKAYENEKKKGEESGTYNMIILAQMIREMLAWMYCLGMHKAKLDGLKADEFLNSVTIKIQGTYKGWTVWLLTGGSAVLNFASVVPGYYGCTGKVMPFLNKVLNPQDTNSLVTGFSSAGQGLSGLSQNVNNANEADRLGFQREQDIWKNKKEGSQGNKGEMGRVKGELLEAMKQAAAKASEAFAEVARAA